ncbi:alpha-glucosidase [Alkalibacterium iburiense]|uniref:Alpha-glucosidase n=1 Tax=Alkalibacterium iburiense TaxID=290589 RepID=A0ABN0XIM9_9LACT
MNRDQQTKWWQEAVVYQIYPRSFQDSNGDGIGDIPGIIQRLDYLEDLGIQAIWLCPVYASPNEDNGYDISDYETIHPEYGTMADMETLIKEADKRNIRIVMDLIVNHTSDQHRWFQEAKKGKDNPYRDYYVWRDPVEEGPPNDLTSGFSESAWEYDESSQQYYLHLFSKKQPDLNWENPQMRHEIYNMMNFWIDKGIKGFRLDVIDLIGKVPDEKIEVNGPKLHDYLQEMHACTFEGKDLMTVGEAWSAGIKEAKLYSDPKRKELSMVFQFQHILLDQQMGKEKWDLQPLNIVELKKALSVWQTDLNDEGWNSLFWNNHDLPRIISRWGNDTVYRERSGKLFAILLHLMKGTPYIYQGEEIGMTNRVIDSLDEVDDIESINMYKDRITKGFTHEELMDVINKKGRDNARTPMHWNETDQAGFTTGEPWLAVQRNYPEINVQLAQDNAHSIYYTYKRLIQLRKDHPLVIWGDYELLYPDHPTLFAYKRSYEGEEWVVMANLSEQETPVRFEVGKEIDSLLLCNTERTTIEKDLILLPYEAFVVKLK